MTTQTTESILDRIGSTPLVELSKLPVPGSARVFAKCEHMNPGGSVKDRIALAMVKRGEERGFLKPGD